MTEKFDCTICNSYCGKKRGHLRNHLKHTTCGDTVKERNALKRKHLSDAQPEFQHESSPGFSIHSEQDYPALFPSPPAHTYSPPDPPPPPPKKYRTTIIEVEDEETAASGLSRCNFTSQDFVGAGAVKDGLEEKNAFERFRDNKQGKGEEIFSPFKSREEWQLARWLMLSGISHSDIDAFAKLPIVS